MFDVVTIGGASRDIFFITKAGKVIDGKKGDSRKLLAFEFGAKIIPEEVFFSYGGGAFNTAVSFSRLGFRTASAVNIGTEGTGSLVYQKMEEEGIDTAFVRRDKNAHTALSVIVSNGSDHTMFLYRDANDNLSINNWGKLKETEFIYLASLSGKSTEILNDLFKFIKEAGIKLIWNPGSKQLEEGYHKLKDLLEVTKILNLNKQEAKELVASREGTKVNLEDEKVLLQKLKEMGPEAVVITDGLRGSFATDGKENYFEPCFQHIIKETTGAGDAYGSAFAASQILGNSIHDSMKFATKNAASVVAFMGAQEGLLKKEELFK